MEYCVEKLEVLKKNELEKFKLYSCGPLPMMKRIVEIAEEYKIPTQLSLENRMACGLGTCRGCVVPTKNKKGFEYKTVCEDGPIFDGSQIIFT